MAAPADPSNLPPDPALADPPAPADPPAADPAPADPPAADPDPEPEPAAADPEPVQGTLPLSGDPVADAVATALAEERALTEARVTEAREKGAADALEAEASRLADEARRSELSERERLEEDVKAANLKAKLATETAEAKDAEAKTAGERLDFVRALSSGADSLARNASGQVDTDVEDLAFSSVKRKVAAGATHADAITQLKAERPWMFVNTDPGAAPPTTITPPGGARGSAVPPAPPSPTGPIDSMGMDADTWRQQKREAGIH